MMNRYPNANRPDMVPPTPGMRSGFTGTLGSSPANRPDMAPPRMPQPMPPTPQQMPQMPRSMPQPMPQMPPQAQGQMPPEVLQMLQQGIPPQQVIQMLQQRFGGGQKVDNSGVNWGNTGPAPPLMPQPMMRGGALGGLGGMPRR